MTCSAHASCSAILVQLLIIGLANGAGFALNAIGFMLIYNITQSLNLVHGDLFALTTVLVTTLVARLGLHSGLSPLLLSGWLLVILLAALAFGGGMNIVIERLAFRPFRRRSHLAPLIATMGLSFILYQVALVWRYFLPNWRPGEHRSVPGVPELPRDSIPELLPTTDLLHWLGVKSTVVITPKDLLVIGLACGGAWAIHWFLQRTALGKAMRACAESPEQAQLCGIDPERIFRLTFGVGGVFAGFAAFIFALYYTHPFTQHGLQSSLLAFAVAILGGAGNPITVLYSGFLSGLVAAYSDYFIGTQWTPVLMQLLLIGLLVLRPLRQSGDGQQSVGSDAIAATPTGQTARSQQILWGLLVIGLLYPIVDQLLGWHWQVTITSIGIFVLLALGLNLLLGFAGLLNLGYAASFGIGCYITALLTDRWGNIGATLPQPLDFMLVLALSSFFAALIGAFTGALTIRLPSDKLAIVTLAISQVVRFAVSNLDQVTGGNVGLAALPPPVLLGRSLQTPLARYYLVLGVLLVAVVFCQRLRQARIGRAWLALGADEVAAASCGVAPARYKTLAFAVGTALAGAAGALYVSCFSYVDPEVIDFRISAMILAMVILGGAGSIPGVIGGALAIASYDRMLIPWLGDQLAQLQKINGVDSASIFDVRSLSYLTFGLALYLTVLIRVRRASNRV